MNIFTFLRENKIILEVKTRLLPIIAEKKNDIKLQLIDVVNAKAEGYEEIAVDWIVSKIELPLLLKPFKPLVKKAIRKNLDKLVTFIQIKIQEV